MQLHELTGLERVRRQSPAVHALMAAQTYLMADLFTGLYYPICMDVAVSFTPEFKKRLQKNAQRVPMHQRDVFKKYLETVDAARKWAQSMRDDGFHTAHSHVFLSLWAVQESGCENIVTAMIEHNEAAAAVAAGKLKPGKVATLGPWPWPHEKCRGVVALLERESANQTDDAGVNAFGRLQTLFGWYGISIEIQAAQVDAFNEANGVRNLLLHQYGKVADKDVVRYPALQEFAGKQVVMSGERFTRYHDAILSVFNQLVTTLPSSPFSMPS